MQIRSKAQLLREVHSFFAKSNMQEYLKASKTPPFQVSNLRGFQRQSINHDNPSALIQYEGQPNLRQYLSFSQSPILDFESDGLSNRQMKRLSKQSLPRLLYLYETIVTAYEIEEVQLFQDADHPSQWKFKSLRQNSQNTKIKKFDETSNDCLVVAQTIVWTKLSFQRFKKLFDGNSRVISKILRKLKGSNQSKISDFQTQSENLIKVLYRLFCLPYCEQILWPSIVLQPAAGSKQLIKSIIIDPNSKQPNRHITQIEIFEDTIKQYLVNVMLKPTMPCNFQPNKRQAQLLKEISQKMNKQVYYLDEFIVRLIGTNATIVEKEVLLEWNQFSSEQLKLIIAKTPFEHILPEINKVIQRLNEFKKMEYFKANGKQSLFKLCKYKDESAQYACIPIRFIVNQQKNILIRRLEKNHKQVTNQFVWVNSYQLTVNETLPKHNSQERKFYNSFSLNFSIEQVLTYIYNSFFGKNAQKYINILRIAYPFKEIEQKLNEVVRCLKCNYFVRDEEYLCCKFCLIKFHLCCIKRLKNKEKKYFHNIYETQQDENVWCCQACSPCKICYQSISDLERALKCKLCCEIFHFDCGKIGDKSDPQMNKQAFICQECLNCSLCGISFKYQHYFIQNQKAICSECLCKYHSQQYCIKCNEQMDDSEIVRCKSKQCRTKSHAKCDSVLLQLKKETFNMQNFKCSICRKGQKRKVILWIIEELRLFDQCEYFDDPEYEDIPEYFEIIKDPMCLVSMRSKALSGQYDLFAYQKLCKDIRLIANNAMTFNMPREQVHFKAKILLVAGQRYLLMMKELLEYNEYQIMTKQLEKIYLNLKTAFYRDLYRNFPNYLINYGKKSAKIEFIPIKDNQPSDHIFSSRHILIDGFKNSRLKYHFSTNPESIDKLFNIPKLISANWSRMSQNLCFYHPKQRLPIIYQCKICWETYCCTKTCFKHIFCCICRKYGCCCNQSECICPPMRQKQRKMLQKQVKPILEANSITKLQYTEYNKYCLRCVRQKQRNCSICNRLCYFGYQICKQCKKAYHIACFIKSNKNKNTEKSEDNNIQSEQSSLIRIQNLCYSCSRHNKQYKQLLSKKSKDFDKKVKKITQHVEIFKQIYLQNGLRLKNQDIINLVLQNYNEYQKNLAFINQFSSSIVRNHQIQDDPSTIIGQQSSIIEDRFLSAQMLNHEEGQNEINNNILTRTQEQYCFLKASAYRFSSKIRQEFVFAKFNQLKISQQVQTYQLVEDKCLQMKDMLINFFSSKKDIISPLSKRNSFSSFRQFTTMALNVGGYGEYIFETKKEQQLFLKQTKQFEQYLRYKYFQKAQVNNQILENKFYYPFYQPFKSVFIWPQLSQFKIKDYFFTRKQLIRNCLKKMLAIFAMNIYNSSKIVLRKGNTYLLESNQADWKIYKTISDIRYFIRLYKDPDENWILSVNQQLNIVKTISDIMNVLRSLGARVNSFEQIVAFLGFSLIDAVHIVPTHFKRLLQHREFHEMSAERRKIEVSKIYNEYQWLNDGIVEHKQTKKISKMRKKQLFFLKKRISQNKAQQDLITQSQESKKPFVTLQDLKKQVFPKQNDYQAYFEQQPNMSHNPLNDVYIAPSRIDRLGLFIGRNVYKYTTIIEYVGQIISESIADFRQSVYKDGCYFFTIGQNDQGMLEIIDATHYGNKARYLNHSCDPNCRARVVNVNGKKKIIIYTVRDVHKDEELTYDYQFKIQSSNHIQCKCGSKNCQGRLN